MWATLDQRRRIFELLARRSGLSIPDSEDAVSEAFVRVVRFRHLDQEQLYSFTVMVVRNLSIDILRRQSRERTAATLLAALAATSPGTVTWVAEPGAVIERGETLLRVDNQPVLLLYGKVPMYRDMVRGTKGDDVAQLRANLKELGVTNSEGGNVYTSATAAAVRRWQRDLGLPPTGVVERGRVWFAPGAIRVAQIRAQPGAAAGGEVLTYTGVHKQVDLTLTLDRSDWARVGTEVRVVLPDGGEAAGAVANVEVATTSTDAGEREVVHVTVAVADQEALASFDVVRVEVRYVTQERRDVLTVPVTALLALAEGGYGLEVVAGSTTRLIPVEVGLIADALVEVRGPDLAEGMRVRLPQ